MTLKDHCYYLTRKIWDFSNPRERHEYHQWMISHMGAPFKKIPESECELLYSILEFKQRTGHCPIHENHGREKRRRERLRTVGSWQTLRSSAILRDNNTCQKCHKPNLSGKDCTVDHVIPLFAGGTSALENLQTLCLHCHEQKHKENKEDKRAWEIFVQSGELSRHQQLIRTWFQNLKSEYVQESI